MSYAQLIFRSILYSLFFCNIAFAAGTDYQSDFAYSRTTETNIEGQHVTKSYHYTYHLEPVNSETQPYAEAAFINRVGSVEFSYKLFENRDINGYETGYKSEINYQHMQANSSFWSHFHLGAGKLSKTNFLTTPGTSTMPDSSGIGIGYFITDKLHLAIWIFLIR